MIDSNASRNGERVFMSGVRTHPNATTTPPFSSTTDFLHPGQILSSVKRGAWEAAFWSVVIYSDSAGGWVGWRAASMDCRQQGVGTMSGRRSARV